ncbi:MAG: SIS domain-containing protein [Acidimicrobiales bacterium]
MTAGGAGAPPVRSGPPLPVDSQSMWEATAGLPEQVAAAAAASAAGPLPEGPITNVVVLGMGGSGIAGDVLAAVAGPESAVPVSVVKSYEAPAFVGPDTLVFAVSCSGETEETLAAATAALEAGAALVAVTGGGSLAALAESSGSAVLAVPAGIPQPRAALGAMAVPPLVVLDRLGLLVGVGPRLDAAVNQLERRRDELVGGGGPAEVVARRIGRTFPLVHGSPGLAGVAAQRWKTQVNENAKSPAFYAVEPELCHNEVAGWGEHGDITRQVLTLVTLRRDGEDPRIAARFALVEDLLLEVVADMVEVRAAGEGELAQFFDLVLQGDFVSLHLAGHEGVDPGPVPALGEIKRRLAGR